MNTATKREREHRQRGLSASKVNPRGERNATYIGAAWSATFRINRARLFVCLCCGGRRRDTEE